MVTGELPEYEAIDALNWSLTWTSPNWNFQNIAHQTKSTRCEAYCWTGAKFHLDKYHPEYGDHNQIEQWMEDGGFASWTELHAHHVSVFSDAQTDLPWKGDSVLTRGGSNDKPEAYLVSNPMFWGADPVGNQLPYFDAQHHIRFESQEVATFRTMAGESDGTGWGHVVNELPMYQANMEKGDYSVYGWMGTGAQGIALFNQTYNEDPEIGRWIRDIKWRQALSYAIDRDSLNQVSHLGLGTIRSMAPHPSNIYYPGDEFTQLYTDYDPAKANQLLDALGLVDTDGDGIRNKTGVARWRHRQLEPVCRHERRPAPRRQERQQGAHLPGEHGRDRHRVRLQGRLAVVHGGSRQQGVPEYIERHPWKPVPRYLPDILRRPPGGPDRVLVRVQRLGGRRGDGDRAAEPGAKQTPATCPSPRRTAGPPMPAAPGTSFGTCMTWASTSLPNDPRHIENGKKIYEVAIEQQYWLNTVNFVPSIIFLKRNNFRNVPRHSFARLRPWLSAPGLLLRGRH